MIYRAIGPVWAVFYGAALGNVVRGVPLDAQGYFFAPLWTDSNPAGALPGIVDWYTVLVGVLARQAFVSTVVLTVIVTQALSRSGGISARDVTAGV